VFEWWTYGSSGGGGGYSGGAGGSYIGGGGGSYNAGTNQDNESGINEGHGQVVITRLVSTDWVLASPDVGTVTGGSFQEVVFTFDATTSPGDYSADVHIYSNDPDNSEVVIPINLTVFSQETSYVHTEQQQIASGEQELIPILVHASPTDQIESFVFSVSIDALVDLTPIQNDLQLSLNTEFGAEGIITQTGDGTASVIISGFDTPLNDGTCITT
jgi:hypothetical protein